MSCQEKNYGFNMFFGFFYKPAGYSPGVDPRVAGTLDIAALLTTVLEHCLTEGALHHCTHPACR